MTLKTERLILRELTENDFGSLFEILSDRETMQFYPNPFNEEKVADWIRWNQENYRIFGFGLWAVVLQENNRLIGDCGITMQQIGRRIKPEIGYHIHKEYWRRGYACEAARACRNWLFENTPFQMVFSYMNHTNTASCATAAANGMRLLEEFSDEVNTITKVYGITREEWEKI
ncbi:N-acetyltransferase [Acutalibacter sp. 1XD8-33]|uniref:GNAT family N-acetyltransferase n=1 Tax=Acutalibacter sp. 1XD8-33 TaxID=2320081 RepID=UPI000EA37834|nr:GNAT family N-acetyltransferase [Acutalibacter sp. 1XD8-33]RKJ40445.1 N-acetyltransferase [Acutalibacter sp. 1XD8-33]